LITWLSLLSEFAVVYQISSKLVHAFGLQTPITAECPVRRCLATAVPRQPHYGGHVRNVMGCDQRSFLPIGPLLGELWYFQYFRTWRPSAILNLKKFNIWSRDCHCGHNLLLYTKFNKIGSRVGPPDAHNCWMHNVPLLGNGRCMVIVSRGTCRGHDGMRPPKFHLNRFIDRRVIALPTFCNMAAVRHLEYVFCYFGPPTKSLCGSITLSKLGIDPIFPAGDITILFLLFCHFGWKMPNHAPFLGVLNPLILWVVIQTPKRHILGDDASFKP